MKCWQVVGFAKSFLAINLAAELSRGGEKVALYTDPDHPYARWNQAGHVHVVERSADVDALSTQWLVLDGTAHDFDPDGYLYGFTPDGFRASQAEAFRQRSPKPTLLVLVGYHGAYGDMFPADAVIPWDERQATSILAGVPLSLRDGKLGKRFASLVQRMQGEVLAHVDRRQS